jgi:hypothetical protein
MSTAKQRGNRSPFRLLMRVPVPWVFIVTYLLGVGLEYAWPLHVAINWLSGVGVVGALLFGIGAAFAGWASGRFEEPVPPPCLGKRLPS